MITRNIPLQIGLEYSFDTAIDNLVFFDIETTGFAADSTYLYLIGCAYYHMDCFYLVQWFAEDIKEEARLIAAFFEFIKEDTVLVNYNGTGFDLPYLQRKCSQLDLSYSFDDLVSMDLYKKISPYKKIFKIGNLRQKSLETFLNINRKDIFDGGELIQVYQSYLGRKHLENLKKQRVPELIENQPSQAELLLGQLLLHNEDDIKGLLSISPILAYADLFEKPFRILKAQVEGDQFIIHFELSSSLPVSVSFGNHLIHIDAYQTTAVLSVQIYEGEMKYFYDNYKDYYYLPTEDRAIHKTLANYVDKEHREKAKLSNCYVKKQGIFAPQYETIFAPNFKLDYKDKLSFLEIHTDFLLQEDNLEKYVHHILSHAIS